MVVTLSDVSSKSGKKFFVCFRLHAHHCNCKGKIILERRRIQTFMGLSNFELSFFKVSFDYFLISTYEEQIETQSCDQTKLGMAVIKKGAT